MLSAATVSPATVSLATLAPAWNAALAAALPEQEGQAMAAVMLIEIAIDAAPVSSLADALVKLQLCSRHGGPAGLGR